MFRKTAGNIRELKALNRDLGAQILRPFYPADDLFRIMRDDDLLQLEFLVRIDGMRSYEGLRSRAVQFKFGEHALLAASLADIVTSKKVAGRPKDLAVLAVWRMRLPKPRADRDLIRRWRAKPPEQRTHFRRVRIGIRGSCL